MNDSADEQVLMRTVSGAFDPMVASTHKLFIAFIRSFFWIKGVPKVKKLSFIVPVCLVFVCGICATFGLADENKGLTLVKAAKSRDFKLIQALLNQGADVNAKGDTGMTALMYAAMYGELETAKILIDRGADVQYRDEHGMTPLLAGCMMGHADIVKLLLDKGVNLDGRSGIGTTPLMSAALYNRIEVVRLLLDRGADINAVNSEGMTPLKMASKSSTGNPELVKILKEHGAKE
jgi:ankyrin repeat protein